MIIGLTGGIGTGKSTVSRYMRSLGYPIVDADEIARDVVAKGTEGLEWLVRLFGTDILREDGSLDRAKLSKIVFADPNMRETLNSITGPRIAVEIQNRLLQCGDADVVLDIPLLFEQPDYLHLVDAVWVVYATEEQQISRLAKRNRFSEEEALQRIHAQMSLKKKCAHADVVLDNSGSVESLYEQVDKALSFYSK